MADSLRTGDLAPCDVLLYHGTGLLSDAIRFFDGTDVSHASLYLGGSRVAEALGQGVTARSLTASRTGEEWLLARRLKQPVQVAVVRGRALQFVHEGHRYAYEQLVLLALLCLTRKLPFAASLRAFVRATLDAAAARLEKLVAGGSEPMICSEFVYRCFNGPDVVGRPTIAIDRFAEVVGARRRSRAADRIRGRGVHPQSLASRVLQTRRRGVQPRGLASRGLQSRGRDLIRAPVASNVEIAQLFTNYRRELGAQRGRQRRDGALHDDSGVRAAVGRMAVALANARGEQRGLDALHAAAADFVTPGDLLRSESFFTVGTLAGLADGARRRVRGRQGNRTPSRM